MNSPEYCFSTIAIIRKFSWPFSSNSNTRPISSCRIFPLFVKNTASVPACWRQSEVKCGAWGSSIMCPGLINGTLIRRDGFFPADAPRHCNGYPVCWRISGPASMCCKRKRTGTFFATFNLHLSNELKSKSAMPGPPIPDPIRNYPVEFCLRLARRPPPGTD